ncbi:MAG: exodeoxyribonuclease VII large subunit [Anaerolineae bacterium]|nr:exodeoxyribonuclease VII large subunit [Anaerolineae bacterium]
MIQPDLFQSLEPPILTVGQLNHYLRQLLESDPLLQKIWVQGEVSNVSQPRSGHIYFTLKDDTATLNCVIWRSTAERLKYLPQNGMSAEVRGSISVYEQGGRYQLYVDMVRAIGEGNLYQQFIALKEKLEAEGLFEEERKRPLPFLPKTIGIVTSATGAAVQDMINTLMQRCPMIEVVIAPAAVQGENAPLEIVRALNALNTRIHPDVILVGRGGGSLEDLWCFNDERVVRAVASSTAPVISGVGHETDFTLSDFAADRRAPTPTGAAVMAVPNINDLADQLGAQLGQLNGLMQEQLKHAFLMFNNLTKHLKLVSPAFRIQNEIQRLDEWERRFQTATRVYFRQQRMKFESILSRLHSMNPAGILARGYAIIHSEDGSLIRSITDVHTGQPMHVTLSDGRFASLITEIFDQQEQPDGKREIDH